MELEANTLDSFNICWTMHEWVVGTSHGFVTNTCAYSVSDYKSKNKESLKPPFCSPPAMKIGLSLYLFKLKMSIGKENADIPGIQVKISPSSKGGLSIELKLIYCPSLIRTHKPPHAHASVIARNQDLTVKDHHSNIYIWCWLDMQLCIILKYLFCFAAC